MSLKPFYAWFGATRVQLLLARRSTDTFSLSQMKRIPLWNSDGSFALIDDLDEFLFRWSWRVDDEGYAVTSIGGARVFMHSMLITVPGGCVIDHRNRHRIDNQRHNLRIASARQNAANVSRRTGARQPFVGVNQIPSGKWRARVGERGRHLGVFDSAEEAARARDAAALEEYGEFATLNFTADAERSVDVRPPLAAPRQDRRRKHGSKKPASRRPKATSNADDRTPTRKRAKRTKPSNRRVAPRPAKSQPERSRARKKGAPRPPATED